MKTEFTPINVTLKNGHTVTVRSATVADAAQLLQTVKEYVKDSTYIPKIADEIKITIQQEEDWLESFILKENSILIVATFNDNIIGNLDITGNSRIIMQHTAVIGMGMLSEWRNSGLGTALLQYSIHWAKANPLLELLWLQVYTENKLALNLYRKMGFVENGIIKDYFKQDGRYYDNLTMSLPVK